jgi:hypothetical protein
MVDKLFLKIIYWLYPLWRMLGADPGQFFSLLRIKLYMEGQRPVSWNTANGKKDYELSPWLSKIIKLVFPTLMGGLFVPVLLLSADAGLAMLLYTSFLFIFAMMLLLMVFSTQVADTADNAILLPRPVGSKTLMLFRLAFTGYKFLSSVIPMSVAGIAVIVFRYGIWSGLYFFILLIPMLGILFTFAQLFTLFLLKFVPIAVFRKVIPWFQSILIFSLLLLLQTGIFDKLGKLEPAVLKETKWLPLLPQYWLVQIWTGDAPVWMYIALALCPLFCLAFILRFLAPAYTSKLTELAISEPTRGRYGRTFRAGRFRAGSRLFNNSPVRRAAYRFVGRASGRSAAMRASVLPAYFYVVLVAFPIAKALWMSLHGDAVVISQWKWLLPLYMLVFPGLSAISLVPASKYSNAAWVYDLAPIGSRGLLRQGAFAAIFSRYFVPAFLLWSVIALIFTKGAIWGNLILAFSFLVLIFQIQALFLLRQMPASVSMEDHRAGEGGMGFVKIILLTVVSGLIGGLHALVLVNAWWWVQLLLATLAGIAAWLVWDKMGRTD